MYLLVLLGLLGTFEMNFYGGAKTQFENETGTEMCPSLFAWISSFVRFLVRLSCQSFSSIFVRFSCSIFSPIFSPIFFSFFMFDLLSDFLSDFLVPLISCSIFYLIFNTNFCLIFCAISCPIFVQFFVWSFCPILLSDFLSDILSYFLVRFSVGFVRPIWIFRWSKTAWACVNGRLKRIMQISDHKNIRRILVDRP